MREEKKTAGLERVASFQIEGVLPKKYHMQYRSGQEELVEEQSLKEIEEKIRVSGENIEIPSSLLPENIEKKLAFLQEKKRRQQRIWRIILTALGTVILVLLLLLLLF